MSDPQRQLWLLRHGATEWALNGRHTGSTDLPLLPKENRRRQPWPPSLPSRPSPPCSAHRCNVPAEPANWLDSELRCNCRRTSWNGTTAITKGSQRRRSARPSLTGRSGPMAAPTAKTLSRFRLDAKQRLTKRLAPGGGDVALFAHGHILRALTGTWLGLGASGGSLFKLGTASVSVLGWERGKRAISRWNAPQRNRTAQAGR